MDWKGVCQVDHKDRSNESEALHHTHELGSIEFPLRHSSEHILSPPFDALWTRSAHPSSFYPHRQAGITSS